ncbi:MAG: hypothetical protein H0M93_02105 [Methanophagales archaeon]|nr:hypothetical protein [Methanophagales archaeon]
MQGRLKVPELHLFYYYIIELMKNLDYHGVLNQYTAHDVIDIIDQLIDGGYLITKQSDSNFPRLLLYLTELAEEALEERTAIDLRLPAKTEVVQDSGNLSVLGELKK